MRPALHPVTEHEPDRPEWTCGADGEPWPCAAKRARWLELYDGDYRQLGALLGRLYARMVKDLDDAPADIRERLFGWVPWRRKRPTGVLSASTPTPDLGTEQAVP